MINNSLRVGSTKIDFYYTHSCLPSLSTMFTVAMISLPSERPLLGEGNVNTAMKLSVPSYTLSSVIVIGKLAVVLPAGNVKTSDSVS